MCRVENTTNPLTVKLEPEKKKSRKTTTNHSDLIPYALNPAVFTITELVEIWTPHASYKLNSMGSFILMLHDHKQPHRWAQLSIASRS